MSPIFIIGYMASGKTTFGRALARKLALDFIDLDFYIEQRFRTSIRDIFATRGEEAFRRIESNMLREAGEFDNVVISCGGGTPCFNDNMDYMLARGTTVLLEARPERITERLLLNRSRRPLMADKEEDEILDEVRRGLATRAPHYQRAQIRFGGDLLENRRQIDESVRKFIETYFDNFN